MEQQCHDGNVHWVVVENEENEHWTYCQVLVSGCLSVVFLLAESIIFYLFLDVVDLE